MSEPAAFSVGEVGSMTGLSTHTIRAWERRHDALQPKRSKTGHRQYTTDDVEFLIRVKQLTRAR
ncbi:MAG: MerR family transcriptional regulator, partial [Candidatus Dormibacteraeota bacterium]|nr:MerR family transcriptional regulator [Candidatus Dormibacteraeota bacterium]